MKPVKAVILAAGKGTRLQSEQNHMPKVMRMAAGHPLLHYVLDALNFLPKDDTVIVAGYLREEVMKAFPDYPYAVQDPQQGTGHAVQCARTYLKDFDDGGSGFLTLCLNMYKAGSRYSVVTLGADGTERGSLFIGEEILDFSAAGKYVAVLTASDLRIYDETLTLYASTDNVAAATDVIQRADGSAILISGGSGSLFIP